MKKLGKLRFNSEEILKNEELIKLRGGGDYVDNPCAGKKAGDRCCWMYEGSLNYGHCAWDIFASSLHCSDLN